MLYEVITLPGASIIVKGTSVGTITDVDGNYALDVPENSDVVVLSFMGYKTAEISIAGKSVINYQMELDVAQLNEIVVTAAFGIDRNKKALGYAIEQVDQEAIQRNNFV